MMLPIHHRFALIAGMFDRSPATIPQRGVRGDPHVVAARDRGAREDAGDTIRGVERVVRLLGGHASTALTAAGNPLPRLASPRSFREPLLEIQRAGPGDPRAHARRSGAAPGHHDRDDRAGAPKSSSHRGSPCPT